MYGSRGLWTVSDDLRGHLGHETVGRSARLSGIQERYRLRVFGFSVQPVTTLNPKTKALKPDYLAGFGPVRRGFVFSFEIERLWRHRQSYGPGDGEGWFGADS